MKKFLSLVLALIMTMSLVTISAGATEYRDLTDKDEIQYEEAVAVLNRIGVITGYEDGSFRPETELTRGAAAKIIVSLMIGPEAASALPNNASPYPDVPAGHTFAGVIGYCKTAGYISGYGDGTFKPANPLTGYAFAKMLLGAVGYKSNIEGFVDTGWTMNVARIGNVAGLFDRLNFDGAKAVTRDEACQLALNTLKATMVHYGSTNTVISSSGEVLTVQGSQAQYVTSNNRDINANINRRVISAQNNELTLEFGEEHFKDLRLEHDRYDPAYDIYGHPSNEWSYKKVTIGTFKLPADFTFTKQMAHLEDTVATKEKALGLRGYDTYSTDHKGGYVNWSTAASNQYYSSPFADATQIHINGWNARVKNDAYKQTASDLHNGRWYTYNARDIKEGNKELAPSLSEICDLTDNGVVVEVYVCPVDADFITDVVVTRTQLMEVDRIASDYVELETISSDSKDPYKDGPLTEIAGYNDYSLQDGVISVKDNNYDAYNVLKDLKSGDKVAVIPYTADDGKTWEVGEAYVPETVSGALTNVDIYNTKSKPDGNAVAITVGGTTYPIAQWNKDMREISGTKIRATKKDVTLLLDKMGNALLAKDVGNSDNWIVVGDYYQATLSSGRVGWFVHGWTIKGDEVDLELGTIRGAAEKYAPGELVKYDVAETGNGEYELTKPMFRDSDYTNGQRVMKNGKLSPWTEPQGAEKTIDGDKKQTGEGIYNIAQFANKDGKATQYDIQSKNSLLPLEFYNTKVTTTTAINAKSDDVVHFNYSNATAVPDVGVGPNADECGALTGANTRDIFYDTTDRHDTWTYRTAPYDGVKFIYVGFDSANGEVDVINVVDGVQNVDYEELIKINRWWKNVGTNDDSFVASPAEAYVDKDGKVKAVVIKSDSAEANLKDLMIITDNRGANTSTKGGAEAPTSGTYYTRQYVSGEDGFKEEKTGYFDKALDVGTVITGSLQSDGIIRSKVFHAREYTNRNPDGFYVKGIESLKTQESVKSKTMFYVGFDHGTISYLGTGVKGYDTLKTADILTDKDVMGFDHDYAENNFKGLITVDSTTQFIDLRDGHTGDIDELGDLFDGDKCDHKTVELKVLVNGNASSDGFRHAYVIMILEAKPEADDADGADIGITAKVDGKSKMKDNAAADGKTEATAWTWTVTPGAEVVLKARVTVTGTAENMKWTDLATKSILSDTETLEIEAGEDGTTQTLSFYVENYDPDHANITRAPATRYVKIVSKADAPISSTGNKLTLDAKAVKYGEKVTAQDVDIPNSGSNANKIVWSANIQTAEWSKNLAASDIVIDYIAKVNGVETVIAASAAAQQGVAVGNKLTGNNVFVSGVSNAASFVPGQTVEIIITKIAYKAADIQYWDKDNNKDITAIVLENTDTSPAAAASKIGTSSTTAVTVDYHTNDATNGKNLVATAVSGIDATASTAKTQTLGTANSTSNGFKNSTALTLQASGDGYVKIEIAGISKLGYSLTTETDDLSDGTGVAAKTVDAVHAPNASNDKVHIAIAPTSADSKTPVTIDAGIAFHNAAEYYAYKINIKGYGSTPWIVADNSKTVMKRVWSGTLSEDAQIKDEDITLDVVEMMAVKSAAMSGDDLIITFSRPVANLTVDSFTKGGNTPDFTINDVKVSGAEVTLKLGNTSGIAVGSTITVAATVADRDYPENTLGTAKALTAAVGGASSTWS